MNLSIQKVRTKFTKKYVMTDDTQANYIRDSQICQEDIDMLQRTAKSWCLTINERKCVVLRFPRKLHILPPPCYRIAESSNQVVHSHVDLGVTIDSDLKFHEHIAATISKAAGLAQNLRKSTVCRSPDFMMNLFSTHVRPILEYCSCVWHTGFVRDLTASPRVHPETMDQVCIRVERT